MSNAKWFACSFILLMALAIQLVVFDGLPLPLGNPDLLMLTLICIGLCTGPMQGMVLGFAAGLCADFMGEHAAGRMALVLCVIGYGVGLAADEAERSVLIPFAVVAFASALGVAGYALTGLFTGDPRVAVANVPSILVSRVLYDVVLTPFIYPLIRGLLRKLDPVRV